MGKSSLARVALAVASALVVGAALFAALGSKDAAPRADVTLVVGSFSERTGGALALASGGEDSRLEQQLPAAPWSLSLDARLEPGTRAALDLGGGEPLVLEEGPDGLTVSAGDVRKRFAGNGARHLEVAGAGALRLAVDGIAVTIPRAAGSELVLEVKRGRLTVDNVVASPTADRGLLLLHRLAALHARVPTGAFPLGTGRDGEVRLTESWTTGFWPGALWHAADLTPKSDLFRDWALAATEANLGDERADTHDLGFKYGRSSVAAHRRLCSPAAAPDPTLCARLRDSGLTAAGTLLNLIATNRAAGTLPTGEEGCDDCARGEADTIIDSTVNLTLLAWAARESGRDDFRGAAVRAARANARLLLRPDGSTAQSVHLRRSDGTVTKRHTHQGESAGSTWARGQAWAVYGFGALAEELGDERLLAAAESAAAYVARELPPGGVPPYDYAASGQAPPDVSAGTITAAGLLRLAAHCRRSGGCSADPARYEELGRRLLRGSLSGASASPPLGFLGDQVQTLGGRTSWDDDGELTFGLDHALEALNRAERVPE